MEAACRSLTSACKRPRMRCIGKCCCLSLPVKMRQKSMWKGLGDGQPEPGALSILDAWRVRIKRANSLRTWV